MVEVFASAVVAAPIDRVWALAGDWAGISKWHPFIETSVLGEGPPANDAGATRVCTLVNGASLKESQVERSDESFMYAYSITDGPMPMRNHKGVVQLRAVTDSDETFVEWSATFDADESVLNTIKEMFEAAIPAGLSALKSEFV